MVNSELLVYLTPGMASLAVAGAAWGVSPRRAAAISMARRSVRRWIPAALVALISLALGVIAYVGHAPEITGSRAVGGALVAVVASVLPLSVYLAMGRLVRHLVMLVAVWMLSLVPLYYYALIALLIVVGYTQCGPGSSDCPIG